MAELDTLSVEEVRHASGGGGNGSPKRRQQQQQQQQHVLGPHSPTVREMAVSQAKASGSSGSGGTASNNASGKATTPSSHPQQQQQQQQQQLLQRSAKYAAHPSNVATAREYVGGSGGNSDRSAGAKKVSFYLHLFSLEE